MAAASEDAGYTSVADHTDPYMIMHTFPNRDDLQEADRLHNLLPRTEAASPLSQGSESKKNLKSPNHADFLVGSDADTPRQETRRHRVGEGSRQKRKFGASAMESGADDLTGGSQKRSKVQDSLDDHNTETSKPLSMLGAQSVTPNLPEPNPWEGIALDAVDALEAVTRELYWIQRFYRQKVVEPFQAGNFQGLTRDKIAHLVMDKTRTLKQKSDKYREQYTRLSRDSTRLFLALRGDFSAFGDTEDEDGHDDDGNITDSEDGSTGTLENESETGSEGEDGEESSGDNTVSDDE